MDQCCFFVDLCLNSNGMGKGVRPLLDYFFLAVAERLKGKVILPIIVIGKNRFCNLMIDIIKVLVLKLARQLFRKFLGQGSGM